MATPRMGGGEKDSLLVPLVEAAASSSPVSSKSSINWKKVTLVALAIIGVLAFIALNVVTFGSVFHVGLAVVLISTAIAAKILIAEGAVLGLSAILVARHKFRKSMRDYTLNAHDKAIINNPAHADFEKVRDKYFATLVGTMRRDGIWRRKPSDLGGKTPTQVICDQISNLGVRLDLLDMIETNKYWPMLSHLDLSIMGLDDKKLAHFEGVQILQLHNSSGIEISYRNVLDLPDDFVCKAIIGNRIKLKEQTPKEEIMGLLSGVVDRAKEATRYQYNVDVSNDFEVALFTQYVSGSDHSNFAEAIKELSDIYQAAKRCELRKAAELAVEASAPVRATPVLLDSPILPSGEVRPSVDFTVEDVVAAKAIYERFVREAKAIDPTFEPTPKACAAIYLGICGDFSPQVADAYLGRVLPLELRLLTRDSLIADFANPSIHPQDFAKAREHLLNLVPGAL